MVDLIQIQSKSNTSTSTRVYLASHLHLWLWCINSNVYLATKSISLYETPIIIHLHYFEVVHCALVCVCVCTWLRSQTDWCKYYSTKMNNAYFRVWFMNCTGIQLYRLHSNYVRTGGRIKLLTINKNQPVFFINIQPNVYEKNTKELIFKCYIIITILHTCPVVNYRHYFSTIRK